MDFEERAKKRRRQAIKVLIAEVGMVFSIIAIVVVATLASMGFFVSRDGKIEQSGLIQIHSMPTGATVELDGVALFPRTNLSRSLPPGDHALKISRDGYDSWSKTVKMYSGMLIRLYYPRLFLQNRTPETVMKLGNSVALYEPSIDFNYILYSNEGSILWHLMNIRNDEARESVLDLAGILPGVKDGRFEGSYERVIWSKNSDSVLIKVVTSEATEWILVNLKDLKQSLNITRTFGLDITQIEMMDGLSNQLFVLENQQLRKINTADRTISRVLLSKVKRFANYNNKIIYVTMDDNVATSSETLEKTQKIGVYRDGDQGGTIIATAKESDQVLVAISKYYDDEYMTYIINDELTIHYGPVPAYQEKLQDTDFTGFKTLISKLKLSYVPEKLDLSPEADYLVARRGKKYMVVDLEMGDVFTYEATMEELQWFDNSMIASTVEGKLDVWDFDHSNLRTLVKEDVANYRPVVSSNNRFMYYVHSGEKDGLVLTRERIRD